MRIGKDGTIIRDGNNNNQPTGPTIGRDGTIIREDAETEAQREAVQAERDAAESRRQIAATQAEANSKRVTGIVLGTIIGAIPGIILGVNGYPIIVENGFHSPGSAGIFLFNIGIGTTFGLIGGINCEDGAKYGGRAGVIIGIISLFVILGGGIYLNDLLSGPFLLLLPIVFGICGLIIGAISGSISRAIRR